MSTATDADEERTLPTATTADVRRSKAEHDLTAFYAGVQSFMESEFRLQEEEWSYILSTNDYFLRRFSDLKTETHSLSTTVQTMHEQLSLLPQCFQRIADIERDLAALEGVAHQCEVISKVLENRYVPHS